MEKEKIYNQLRIDNKDDREIFDTLSSRLEERKSIVEEHARIDALYRMTSGNVSGSRMDLETYVQRYYLERILYAANRRFQEMSAGQFNQIDPNSKEPQQLINSSYRSYNYDVIDEIGRAHV